MTPLVEVLTRTTDFFRQRGIPSPRLDAELLLGHVLGLDRVKVYLNFDRPIDDPELERLRALVRRRGNREPLAWVLGHKEFYGRDFVVTPGVLVPRPDTEALIEAVLERLPPEDDAPVYVADVGSGTGCIGLTLALERPAVRLYAVDLAEAALTCTRENIERYALKERVGVRRGDGLAAVPADRPVDWLVSNPPYIPTAAIDALAPEIARHEPRLALDGGADGLACYRSLVAVARGRVRRGVCFEVGDGQAPAVAALLEASGLAPTWTRKDLSGVERVVGVTLG
jgi:release factor glutamine methyltransferase